MNRESLRFPGGVAAGNHTYSLCLSLGVVLSPRKRKGGRDTSSSLSRGFVIELMSCRLGGVCICLYILSYRYIYGEVTAGPARTDPTEHRLDLEAEPGLDGEDEALLSSALTRVQTVPAKLRKRP